MANAKSECEELLSAVMPFAEQMVQEHHEFFPFGATMNNDGEMAHAGGWMGEEQPESTEVIELLERGFREGARNGEYKATALVYDVRIVPPGKTDKQDAIAVAVDHRDDDTSGDGALDVIDLAIGRLIMECPVCTCRLPRPPPALYRSRLHLL